MGESYRIRTELGVNKTINVQLDQDFEFLEILSLKIQQADIYTRNCAEYGVVVGRVTANNGFGIPNARVSIFIPVDAVDQSNPIISSIYPYQSPSDKNEDGYRYNLLPYEKSYSSHAATGTFPSRLDALTATTAVDIYDKYYKLTAKTNESGDYMIFGVPTGFQNIIMDVDLSDIGEFSLSPQDLIRLGLATEAQVGGSTFNTSTDLNSLPQIINIQKTLSVAPLWGDPTICQIAINRVDFDLRDEANIDIQPTAVFMGSIFSSPDDMRIRPNRNFLGIDLGGGNKPKDNFGNLCDLTYGPGQILAIRQTIFQDEDGNPVLEQYRLENSGNVIDENGAWLVEVPMNLDYYTTNEFGERILSNDPQIGIPTKGKYRFKIKWQQSKNLTQQVRRPHYLVPNVKEYGWVTSEDDPNFQNNDNPYLKSSYYFGLAWTGYTQGFNQTQATQRLNEIINCEDTFYQFTFNKVYTVANLIDEFKNGARGRFIGIKEIDDNTCAGSVNKFPVNEGFKSFDLFYFIVSLLLQIIQVTFTPTLVIAHLIVFFVKLVVSALCLICGIPGFGFICRSIGLNCESYDFTIKLPMITYPECQACDCGPTEITKTRVNATTNGVLTFVSDPNQYSGKLQDYFNNQLNYNPSDAQEAALITSQALGGNNDPNIVSFWKVPKSVIVRYPTYSQDIGRHFAFSSDLPVGERINIFNLRKTYFDGFNKIKVTFAEPSNIGKFHYDNTITVLSNTFYNAGDLLTSVNPATTSDLNYIFTAATNNGLVRGITGTTQRDAFNLNVTYAQSPLVNAPSVSYYLPTGSTVDRSVYPMDREYYQVITAITIADASKLYIRPVQITNENGDSVTQNLPVTKPGSFPDLYVRNSTIRIAQDDASGFELQASLNLSPPEFYDKFGEQYILILQRGVDPYSPKYTNKYSLGTILGLDDIDDLVVTANTRVNIPIQALPTTTGRGSVQNYTQTEMTYQSSFFNHGSNYSAFTSSSVGYYGKLDANIFYEDEQNYALALQRAYEGTPTPGDLAIFDNYYQGPNFLDFYNYNGVVGVRSETGNAFYLQSVSVSKYDNAEDLSAGSFMSAEGNTNAFDGGRFNQEEDVKFRWYSKVSLPNLLLTPMSFNDKTRAIFRNDRLPSSDQLDGLSWENNTGLLQQNNNFTFYVVESVTSGGVITSPGYSTGAEQVSPDIVGLPAATSVFESFGCQGMVSLKCYEGTGDQFKVNQECAENDYVENGCYVLLKQPLIGLFDDIKSFSEWGYRFRFFYGLCRGVINQTFTNNWINGSLFMFPIQTTTVYPFRNNDPTSLYPSKIVYFDRGTNNFYVRSSPYNLTTQKFVGYNPPAAYFPTNERNLLFPTTIIDLGMKYNFYAETIFEPYANGYIMDQLEPTSYGDTSDIINFFAISRITDYSFIRGLINYGNSAINQLFTRNGDITTIFKQRVDGDLAQNLSINSEIGVIKFSPEFYDTLNCDQVTCDDMACKYTLSNNTSSIQNYTYYDSDGVQQSGVIGIGGAPQTICADKSKGPFLYNQLNVELVGCCDGVVSPVTILGSESRPVMAIWFSSTTQDLQTKDYLTPGRINFRTINGNNFPFYYGIKSQVVPMYQWKVKTTTPIFGNDKNNWATGASDIVAKPYQSLDRTDKSFPTYFQSNQSISDLTQRGYIYSETPNGVYSSTGALSNKFIVGAPFQFYFGVVKGASALDKFKTKYLADE